MPCCQDPARPLPLSPRATRHATPPRTHLPARAAPCPAARRMAGALQRRPAKPFTNCPHQGLSYPCGPLACCEPIPGKAPPPLLSNLVTTPLHPTRCPALPPSSQPTCRPGLRPALPPLGVHAPQPTEVTPVRYISSSRPSPLPQSHPTPPAGPGCAPPCLQNVGRCTPKTA